MSENPSSKAQSEYGKVHSALMACIYMLGVFHSALVRQGRALSLEERAVYQRTLLEATLLLGNSVLDHLSEGKRHTLSKKGKL